jgi:chemotaxis protein histidine kinase CheA
MSELDNNNEIVGEFLVESHENLDRLDRELVVLEKEPGERSVLASIFRTIHTIKGTAGFLGFAKLESLTHAGENLLSRLRDGELSVDPEDVDVVASRCDLCGRVRADKPHSVHYVASRSSDLAENRPLGGSSTLAAGCRPSRIARLACPRSNLAALPSASRHCSRRIRRR